MKKFVLKTVLGLSLLATMSLTSCSSDDDDDDNNSTKVTTKELSGSVKSTTKLDSTITYTITGPVIVEEGGVLTIPAGTTIKATKGFSSYILVLQGGKININGTSEKPVIMTADDETAATSGYWGGLIINGKAPLQKTATGTASTGSTEINSAYIYGGSDASDNSGTIKYLEIKYAGARSSANVEHNGLTLNGVGNGTTIENIYVYKSADDGIEFFGGSVNVTNLLVVSPDDDMFDFTQGYTGELKNAYGIWEKGYASTESDPRGVEIDGNWDGLAPTVAGQSNFKITNITIDLRLDSSNNATKVMQDAFKVRRGATVTVSNALVKGTGLVTDMVDFSDGLGNGTDNSIINITNSLTYPLKGKAINPTTGVGVTIGTSGNAGCATSTFAWTKYSF